MSQGNPHIGIRGKRRRPCCLCFNVTSSTCRRFAMPWLGRHLLWIFLLAVASATTAQGQDFTKPKVRAITGFVRLDRDHYAQQIAEMLAVLRTAKGEFEKQGYEVQTIRIVTQPLGDLVSGQSDTDALTFPGALDALSAKEDFMPNVGPAMLRDADDPRAMHVLAKALSSLPNIEGNAIIAGEHGIHWKVIRESATLVHYVTEHSPHSQSNFNFTATAMLKPYGPFYPGAYHIPARNSDRAEL